MKMTFLNLLAGLTLGISSFAFGQADGLVTTSLTARGILSGDPVRLVESTYPAYDDAVLTKRLTEAGKELEARPDSVKVRNLQGIERLMGFSPTTAPSSEVDTAKAYYRIDAAKGRAYAQHKNYEFTASSREQFDSMQAKIVSQHRTLFGGLGLPSDEVMKIVFKKVMVQSLDENSTGPSDGSAATVRRGMTLGYRAFKGFPIEGSFVRLSSFAAQRVENVALAWPRFVRHPQTTTVVLANKDAIKREIAEKVKSALTAGQQASLNMGVVFQPVRSTDGRLVHMPAMKVVLTPAARSTSDGTQTDAGHDFFVNILKVSPAVQTGDATDAG